MSEKEKQMLREMDKLMKKLSEVDRAYILGYAEGMSASLTMPPQEAQPESAGKEG